MKPYQAVDIANYIVKKSLDKNRPISNLKLQKILYYLQARFLVEQGDPLFLDKIEKWKYGPVAPSIYHEFKKYGSSPITDVSDQLIIERDDEGNILDIKLKTFDENEIDGPDRELINQTLDQLDNYGTFELVDMTHKQGPWKDYKTQILSGEFVKPYTNSEIQKYFKNNPEEQIWTNK